MPRLFALLAALALLACGQPEPWEPPKDHDLDGFTPGIDDLESVSFQVQIAAKPGETLTDRTDRALDRLRYLLGPSEAHAQLFPSTLTDTLRLGKGRYKWVQLESAQNLLVENLFLGPLSTRPTCNAALNGGGVKFHVSTARQVSYCNSTDWVPIGGVLRQATPPTCSDSQPVRLYEDSDDDLLYRCVGTTWTPMADDADGDGFNTFIDADDADDAVYARGLTAAVVKAGEEIGPSGDVILTGTLVYATTTTYSGANARVSSGPTLRYIGTSGVPDGRIRASAFFGCITKGDRDIVSWTTQSVSSSNAIIRPNTSSNTIAERLGLILDDYTLSSAYNLFSSGSGFTGRVASFTCRGFSS